jgi:hypothetical protein
MLFPLELVIYLHGIYDWLSGFFHSFRYIFIRETDHFLGWTLLWDRHRKRFDTRFCVVYGPPGTSPGTTREQVAQLTGFQPTYIHETTLHRQILDLIDNITIFIYLFQYIYIVFNGISLQNIFDDYEWVIFALTPQ